MKKFLAILMCLTMVMSLVACSSGDAEETTTEAPATEAPVTEAPVTEAPTTEAPVSENTENSEE